MELIDKSALVAEIERLFKKANSINGEYANGAQHTLITIKDFLDTLEVREVGNVWHDASEEPDDMSHCLIFYGCKESVGHYLHYEPVFYNKKEKVFMTPSFPHPTGYKVEQKSFDGGCVAEIYKDRRDRILISDITKWCYLKDLHNLSNVERIGKNWKEEPVSNVWHDKSENIKEGARVCVLWNSGIITSGEWKYMDERPADIETLKMWAYESDILPTDKQKQKVGMTKEQATKYL